MSALRTPVTLPARAYVSPEIYERERREVFAASWNYICPAATVAAPGSYFATSIAGEPTVVLRDADGTLRALSNVCRHRASEILSGRGACPKVLRCPYHGWTYRHDGQLAAVPEARGFPDLDREAVRLPSFRVGVLAGLVFVTMSDTVEPLETYFGDLAETLAPFRLDRLVPEFGDAWEATYAHNWKVIADNYLEGYHIPVGHPGLLRLLDYKRYTPHLRTRHAFITGPFREKPSKDQLERSYQESLVPMPGFPEQYRESWNYVHLWPSTFIDLYPDMIGIWVTRPDGLQRTASSYHVLRSPEETPEAVRLRSLNMHINGLVMDEDVVLCDGVQRGLGSLTYERGVLHDSESAIHQFHELLRQHVPGIDEP
jgi:Rieske 2Fe-2S family protein